MTCACAAIQEAWAHKVIDEYENLCDLGEAVGTLDGKVVDKYEYDFAKRTLDWAAACAAKDRWKANALKRASAEG